MEANKYFSTDAERRAVPTRHVENFLHSFDGMEEYYYKVGLNYGDYAVYYEVGWILRSRGFQTIEECIYSSYINNEFDNCVERDVNDQYCWLKWWELCSNKALHCTSTPFGICLPSCEFYNALCLNGERTSMLVDENGVIRVRLNGMLFEFSESFYSGIRPAMWVQY